MAEAKVEALRAVTTSFAASKTSPTTPVAAAASTSMTSPPTPAAAHATAAGNDSNSRDSPLHIVVSVAAECGKWHAATLPLLQSHLTDSVTQHTNQQR